MKRNSSNGVLMASKTQIPKGWRLVRLGEVAEVNPRRPRLNVLSDTPVAFLPMVAIAESSQGIMARESRPYFEVSTGYTYFEEDDFLFSKITPCLQNGKHALATGLKGGFGFGTTEFHVVRAGSSLAAPFMFRVLTQANIIDRCAKSFTGTAGQQRIQPDTLKDLPILLPPLPEQRAIAAVLDSIGDAIEGTEAVIAATEQLRGSLLHELLARGVPGWHTEWKEVPGLGTIPAAWEVVRLGEVAEVIFSSVDKKTVEGEIPVLLCNYTDVFYNRRVHPEMDFMAATANPVEHKRWTLNRGDVLFTKDSETPDEIGIPAFVEADMPNVLCGYHLGLARPDAQLLDGTYLAEAFASQKLAVQFARIANGVTRFGLTLGATNQLPIPLPPLAEQQAIAGLLAGADVTVAEAKSERDTLQLLKESIADALLTGRVRLVNGIRE